MIILLSTNLKLLKEQATEGLSAWNKTCNGAI